MTPEKISVYAAFRVCFLFRCNTHYPQTAIVNATFCPYVAFGLFELPSLGNVGFARLKKSLMVYERTTRLFLLAVRSKTEMTIFGFYQINFIIHTRYRQSVT